MLRRLEDRKCLYCGKTFRPSDSTRKYCSPKCSQESRIILRDHICEFCGKAFKSKKKEQKYCSIECQYQSYKVERICTICGKSFFPDHGQQTKCRECLPKRGQIEDKFCEICGRQFHPKRNEARYCSNKCKNIAKTTLKDIECPICGKIFHQTDKNSKYCSKDCFYKSDNWRTIPEKITKPNIEYKGFLETLGYNVILEKRIGYKSFDLGMDGTVIEINPFAYHNSTRFPYNTGAPKKSNYHYIRYKYATDNGYRCIMVRDWTTNNELIQMIKDKGFHYEGPPRLHRYNPKTKEHIIDEGLDKKDMLSKGFLEIYDCGTEVFTS